MSEFMDFYWDWGIIISGILVFFGGFSYGALWYKDRCEKRIHEEKIRVAITNTIDNKEN